MSLYWLVTGRTLGGTTMYPKENRLDRTTALRLWTEGNTWFSNEEGKKGAIKAGQLADLAVLSADYMTVPEDQIKNLTSVLTIVGGNVVYGDGPFGKLAPPLPPASPDWSPVRTLRRLLPARAEKRRRRRRSPPRLPPGRRCAVHGQQPAARLVCRHTRLRISASSGARSAAIAGWVRDAFRPASRAFLSGAP